MISFLNNNIMKKLILVIFLTMVLDNSYCQTTVTIGTGTATQQQPFGMWASYERSASVYLSTEIGSFGSYGLMIDTLGWNVGTGEQTTCPTKIYLKSTTSTNLTAMTWASITNGATLVYDASTNFPIAGWRKIDIADFAYTSGNLLVLCETNYGGSGATFRPIFKYSYFPNKHQFWYEYDDPPTGNGEVNENRPNIRITYTILTDPVAPPSGFMATALSSSQVNLNWIKNAGNDDVMVAYNVVNSFGIPSGSYIPGNVIDGGGTVIYSGSGSAYNQTTGLDPGTTYYYKAWSVNPPAPSYSIPTGSAAATFCDAVSVFPHVVDFEAPSFPPTCWMLSALPWIRSVSASGYGSGSASTYADFFNSSAGGFELTSPELDFGSLFPTTISFDHAYATYETQVDKLELWYSVNNGSSFLLLNTWLGGINGPLNTAGATTSAFIPDSGQWGTISITVPTGTNKLMFRGVSGYGNNLYLDNITFQGECSPPANPFTTNITSSSAELGWTPSGPSGIWQIKWGIAGFDTLLGGTLITGVTSNPYLLESLQTAENYEFYVRTDCGAAFSPWEGPVTFTTICDVLNIPISETFDNVQPPSTGCYEVTDNNGDNVSWTTSSSNPLSFPNSMYISQNGILQMDDWFFSSGMDLHIGLTYILSFAYRSDGNGLPEMLEVKWGTDPYAAAMTGGQIWNDPDIDSADYIYGYASFTPAESGVFYLGWHGYSPAGTGFLSVDDIVVDHASVSWTGGVSDDWDEPMNWSTEAVPNVLQNVTVLSGSLYDPIVYFNGPECKDLTIDPGATLTINPDGGIIVNGNLTISETAALNNQGVIDIKGNFDNQNPN